MKTMSEQDADIRKLISFTRNIKFARYKDGKRGPEHASLAGAMECAEPMSTLTNRRGIAVLSGISYVWFDDRCIVLINGVKNDK